MVRDHKATSEHIETTPKQATNHVRYPRGYLVLIVASALDAICTWWILVLGGQELNPIANAVLSSYGFAGMVVFKFALVTLAIVMCEEISRHRPWTGYVVLGTGIAMTLTPVTLGSIELLSHLSGG